MKAKKYISTADKFRQIMEGTIRRRASLEIIFMTETTQHYLLIKNPTFFTSVRISILEAENLSALMDMEIQKK